MKFLELFFKKNKDYLINNEEKEASKALIELIELKRELDNQNSNLMNIVEENIPIKPKSEIMYEDIGSSVYSEFINEDEFQKHLNILSMAIYILSFKRTGKKVYSLSENQLEKMIKNPEKHLAYNGILKILKESIENTISKIAILGKSTTIKEADETILILLKFSANEINKIKN